MILLCAALLGGILLFWSQPPRRQVAWRLPALILFAWSVQGSGAPLAQVGLGALFGLAYIAPTLYHLRLLPLVTAVLGLIQTLEWALLALGVARLLHWHLIAGAFGSAGLATALVWLDVRVVPLWGTAQSWSRPWSHHPRAVQFACFTGWSGSVFFVTAPAFLAASAPRSSAPIQPLLALVLVVAFVVITNEALWRRVNNRVVRVATIGWKSGDFDGLHWNHPQFQVVLTEAIVRGARFIVTPEAAFNVVQREAWRRQVGAFAAQHHLALAIGYFDQERQQNCIDFVDENGEIMGCYFKTHLVPIFERYNAGIGKRSPVELQGARVGGVVCQDDNFTDVARGYGRDKVQLLAVPTHDWAQVKDFHLTSTLWRVLENRYAIARATNGGISVLVSARGEVLEHSDHFRSPHHLLVTDVPVGAGKPTFYARYGDWFPLLCGLVALGCLLSAR